MSLYKKYGQLVCYVNKTVCCRVRSNECLLRNNNKQSLKQPRNTMFTNKPVASCPYFVYYRDIRVARVGWCVWLFIVHGLYLLFFLLHYSGNHQCLSLTWPTGSGWNTYFLAGYLLILYFFGLVMLEMLDFSFFWPSLFRQRTFQCDSNKV